MDEVPVLHHYRVSDRAEVFDFIREVFPAPVSSLELAQWIWKYEANPFTPSEGPAVNFIRVGSKMVGLSAGFRLKMWMGGIECFGEGRGAWAIHRDYRKQNLWRRSNSLRATDSPILFGWSKLGPNAYKKFKWVGDPIRPLLRILDPGPLIASFAGSGRLAALGAGATAAARFVSQPLRRTIGSRRPAVVRLDAVDDRVDALWERARRPSAAMVVRDRQYLDWRYCQRPDATYLFYGVERSSELEGLLVARFTTYRGMPWGYLVDFMAAENSTEVLTSLIAEATDELRRLGAAAIACFNSDRTTRRALYRSGFFPLPQRSPVHFIRFIRAERPDLARFTSLDRWYLTMGDGDFDMLY
jgi:hypothetical protein